MKKIIYKVSIESPCDIEEDRVAATLEVEYPQRRASDDAVLSYAQKNNPDFFADKDDYYYVVADVPIF